MTTRIEAPRFSLSELRELRHALAQANLYVGPVGISPHATDVFREAHHWRERLDSLIGETAEWEGRVDGC